MSTSTRSRSARTTTRTSTRTTGRASARVLAPLVAAALLAATGSAISPTAASAAPATLSSVASTAVSAAPTLVTAALGLQATRIAAAQKGDPYRWGASGPSAFDCSGLVYYVYTKRLGKNLPRTASAQRLSTVRIAKTSIRAGDLVFFTSYGRVYHVGVYAGSNKVWHSPRPGRGSGQARPGQRTGPAGAADRPGRVGGLATGSATGSPHPGVVREVVRA